MNFKNTQAFTLIEILIAMVIGVLLLTLVYAPYNFYANKSRVGLSAERLEQAFSRAYLLASTGFAPIGTNKNVDLALVLKKGESEVLMYSVVLGQLPTLNGVLPIEKIPLESNVVITELVTQTPGDYVTVVFRAPQGKVEFFRGSEKLTTFTGGIVGVSGATSGPLSKKFIVRYE